MRGKCREYASWIGEGWKPEIVVQSALLPFVGFLLALVWSLSVQGCTERWRNIEVRQQIGDEIRLRTQYAKQYLPNNARQAKSYLDGGESSFFIYPEFASVRLFGLLRKYEDAGGNLPVDCEANDPLQNAKHISSTLEPTSDELGVMLKHLKRVFGDDCD
jgi:hypothetical protein